MLPYRVGFWALLLLISVVWLAWRSPATLRQNEEALLLYKVLLQNESKILSELDAEHQPCLERLSSPPFDLKTPLCLSAALYAGDTEVVATALDSEAFAALRPTYWHVIHRMGGEFRRQGDLVRAAQYFELGYQLQVNQISSLNELFSVLRQSGEFERAADLLLTLEDSPTIPPEQRQIWWAYHHFALEAWDEAESAFRALLSTNAYRSDALFGLAQLEWKRGHYEGAVQWYRQIIKEFPENNRAYGLIGALYLNYLGQPEAAIPYLREYVTRVQGQDQYQGYLWLGEAYARLNRSHDAVTAWQQAILLDRERSEAICRLQALYEESPSLSRETRDQATLAALELFELDAKACPEQKSIFLILNKLLLEYSIRIISGKIHKLSLANYSKKIKRSKRASVSVCLRWLKLNWPVVIAPLVSILVGLTWQSTIGWSTFWGLAFMTGLLACFMIVKPVGLVRHMPLLLSIAFALRVLLVFARPEIQAGGDEVFYNRLALLISQGWQSGHFEALHGRGSWYPEVAGFVYLFFGESFFVARLFNSLLGALLVWSTYQTSLRLIRSPRAAILAASLVAISPQLIDTSALIRKDTIIILATTLVVGVVPTQRALWVLTAKRSHRKWLVVLVGLLILYFMRPVAAAAMLFLIIGYLGVYNLQRKHYGIAIAGLMVVILLGIWGLGGWLPERFEWYFALNQAREAEAAASGATAAALVNQFGGNSTSLIGRGLLFLRSLLTPHPFYWLQAINLKNVLLSVAGLIWFGLVIPFTTIALRHYWRDKVIKMEFLVLLFGHAMMIQWLLSSPSVALVTEPIRYRLPIVPLFFIMTGAGLDAYLKTPPRERSFHRHVFATCGMLLLITAYLYIRNN